MKNKLNNILETPLEGLKEIVFLLIFGVLFFTVAYFVVKLFPVASEIIFYGILISALVFIIYLVLKGD